MRRAVIIAALLLFCGVIAVRGLPATAGTPESLLFVFLRVDHDRDIAILRPMIAPDIGVQLDSGPRQLVPGTVLTCGMAPREHDAIVEGQLSKVSEMVLDCAEHKFVIKTIDFSPQRH
jgi:hypothetical protein